MRIESVMNVPSASPIICQVLAVESRFTRGLDISLRTPIFAEVVVRRGLEIGEANQRRHSVLSSPGHCGIVCSTKRVEIVSSVANGGGTILEEWPDFFARFGGETAGTAASVNLNY